MMFPQSLHFSKNQLAQTSDSEEDDEEYYQVGFDLSRLHGRKVINSLAHLGGLIEDI